MGGAIAERLLARKDDVTLLVRDESRLPASDAKRRTGSVLDPNAIAKAAQGADAIFWAVGARPGAGARVYPWIYVAGVENVIAAARHANVPRVVLISSADVTLASQDRVHWNEKRDIADQPFGVRAQSIRLGEEIALALSDDRVSVSAIRPGETSTKLTAPAASRFSIRPTISSCVRTRTSSPFARALAAEYSSSATRTPLRTVHAAVEMFSRATSDNCAARACRCPRLPAVSMGTSSVTLGNHGETPLGALAL